MVRAAYQVIPYAALRSGERRAARIDGYSPAIAPMTRAAPSPP